MVEPNLTTEQLVGKLEELREKLNQEYSVNLKTIKEAIQEADSPTLGNSWIHSEISQVWISLCLQDRKALESLVSSKSKDAKGTRISSVNKAKFDAVERIYDKKVS